MNGISIDYWTSDAQGFFVAKFDIEEIKGLDLIVGTWNTLRLEGWTVDGISFSGADQVRIIDVGTGK